MQPISMLLISNVKTVRSFTVKDLKDFDSQTPATQVERGEHLASMMPSIEKAFEIMCDDIVELSTESKTLKIKICSYVENLSEESKANLLCKINK